MPRPRRASHAHIEAEVRPEVLLAAAILTQAKKDLQSPREDVRADAVRFWQDPTALTMWAELLDVDPAQMQRAMQG